MYYAKPKPLDVSSRILMWKGKSSTFSHHKHVRLHVFRYEFCESFAFPLFLFSVWYRCSFDFVCSRFISVVDIPLAPTSLHSKSNFQHLSQKYWFCWFCKFLIWYFLLGVLPDRESLFKSNFKIIKKHSMAKFRKTKKKSRKSFDSICHPCLATQRSQLKRNPLRLFWRKIRKITREFIFDSIRLNYFT